MEIRREEGQAGAKGQLFLLSYMVALNSETERVPNSNLAFQVAMKYVFSRSEDRGYFVYKLIGLTVTLKYLDIYYEGLSSTLGLGPINVTGWTWYPELRAP